MVRVNLFLVEGTLIVLRWVMTILYLTIFNISLNSLVPAFLRI